MKCPALAAASWPHSPCLPFGAVGEQAGGLKTPKRPTPASALLACQARNVALGRDDERAGGHRRWRFCPVPPLAASSHPRPVCIWVPLAPWALPHDGNAIERIRVDLIEVSFAFATRGRRSRKKKTTCRTCTCNVQDRYRNISNSRYYLAAAPAERPSHWRICVHSGLPRRRSCSRSRPSRSASCARNLMRQVLRQCQGRRAD